MNTKKLLVAALTAAAGVAAWAPALEARITRIVIDAIEPVAGQPYELLTGRAFGELDPNNPQNALITDLELAPRNGNDKVEYIASFRIRKPTDMATPRTSRPTRRPRSGT